MRIVRSTAMILAAAIGLTACAGSSGSESTTAASEATQPLRVATQAPTSLFTPDATGAYAFMVLDNLYDGLIRFDGESGEPVMMVADSIETTDNIVYDVTLKDDYYFSDGEQVTSDSFLTTWSAIADADNAYTNAAKFNEIEGYDALAVADGEQGQLSGITVTDDTHFTITLTAADSQFIYTLGTVPYYPLPSAAWDDPDTFATQPIGDGPYTMTSSWTGEETIDLERWDDYAGEAAKNPGIEISIVSDEAVPYTMFQAGDLDVALVDAADQSAAESSLGDQFVRQDQSASYYYLMLPTFADGYDDQKIRQALSMSIDRQTIIDTFFSSDTVALTDFGVPASIGYRDSTDLPYLSYDPDAAKALWDEAGGGGIDSISIGVPASYGWDDWGQAIIDNWEDVLGVKVDTVTQLANVSTAYDDDFLNPVTRSRYSDTPSPATVLVQGFTKDGTANWSDYYNADFESTIAQALAASDSDEATQLFDDAKDILIEDVPQILLWSEGDSYALSDRVVDFPVDIYNKSNLRDVSVVDE
ncbi:MAG: ABC transporter substrate-binding protein [Microbacteriaceae bacterium]